MAALDRVKVLVLGDSGVGKSSLVHLLCHNQVLGNPSWTVGCSVDVRIHDYKEGTPEEKTYYIELWDVGGSVGSATSVKSTRAVFYNSLNGIILVHDLTNKKSSQNLYRWTLEALNRDVAPTGVLVTNGDYDREQFADNQIPLLVIGTKLDQIPETKRNEVLTRTAFLAEDFNAEEINLDCTNPRYLAAGSSNAVKLSRFFDKIDGAGSIGALRHRQCVHHSQRPSHREEILLKRWQSDSWLLGKKEVWRRNAEEPSLRLNIEGEVEDDFSEFLTTFPFPLDA
ncbi:rab-like protein 3 isoform X1 [Anser cygnoides]|uniref:Rab-like protein 3 n=1 Tax=Anser brachyrhynchus TaxID=132585 RepID=A0A8B9C0G7_9AVES|nr:rab-like protein 3 isoform X1 [Anser cygnoides]